MKKRREANIDRETVEGFGDEWSTFDQVELTRDEHQRLFDRYFSAFPFDDLPPNAEGFDLGCGSGRWAVLAAPRVGKLHCIDPSRKALEVARRVLKDIGNIEFHEASVDELPLQDGSQDFGYSLGVLHHIPDTQAAMDCCVAKLKPGAPFLVYLYYALENRPRWFREVWKATNAVRKTVSRLPFPIRARLTNAIASIVYYPVSRFALVVEKIGMDPEGLPLSSYRRSSFYTMRTDALDRFGTRLEQRFSRAEIEAMMTRAGLERIAFRESPPFWVAVGWKQSARVR